MNSEIKKYFKPAVSIFLLFLAIKYWGAFTEFFKKAAGAAYPLFIGGIIAYVVNILMTCYEKHYFVSSKKKIVAKTRRPVCLAGAFLTVVAVIVLIFRLILPQLILCIRLLAAEVPEVMTFLTDKIGAVEYIPGYVTDTLRAVDWKSWIDKIVRAFTSGVTSVMDMLIQTVTTVFSGLITALLSIIFSIYLLASRDTLKSQAKRVASHYLKPSVFKKAEYVLTVINDCFHKYIVGQCTEAVILGGLCTIGMFILRLPYATMIGALVAFTALIPIAGAYIGAVVGAFMIFTVSPVQAPVFLVFLIILQQLEGNLIYPRVVGSSIGLPGIWVLAAVTVGGGLAGVIGMLAGVPLTAAAYRLLKDDMNRK